MTTETQRKLIELASSQQGFFTAGQAVECGIISTNHTYYTKRGEWQRWFRGIYHLKMISLPPRPDLYAIALYLRGQDQNLQGVFALETAASIHELGDFMPSQHFVMVLPAFHRRFIPKNMVTIRKELAASDWNYVHGLPVTTPLRTILDLADSDEIDGDAVRAAYMAARQKGTIASHNLQDLHDQTSTASQRLILEWEKEYGKLRKSQGLPSSA